MIISGFYLWSYISKGSKFLIGMNTDMTLHWNKEVWGNWNVLQDNSSIISPAESWGQSEAGQVQSNNPPQTLSFLKLV